MPRIFLVLLAAVALLAAACGGSSSGGDKGADAASAPTAAETADDSASRGGGDSGNLLSSFNPFSFLESLNTASPVSGDVDPDLKRALLTSDDLPGGFTSLGDFAASTSTELGDVDMAVTMFTSGDPAADDFSAVGTMVMSAAVALPPEALDELGDPSQLSEVSEDDLAALQGELADLGLAEVELLDASGLGEGGVGMRMSMDFGELFGALGAPADQAQEAAITMETYLFVRGERMYMVMTMWPSQQSPDADARDLAETIDSRAA